MNTSVASPWRWMAHLPRIGENVVVAPDVVIGDNVKIQNNVSVD